MRLVSVPVGCPAQGNDGGDNEKVRREWLYTHGYKMMIMIVRLLYNHGTLHDLFGLLYNDYTLHDDYTLAVK